MTAQSTLLINDLVLPEAGVPAFSASLDLVMLGACGSRERRMKEWQELLDDVGLASFTTASSATVSSVLR